MWGGGEFSTGNYILWRPPHSGRIFHPQEITARNAFCAKFELCICIGVGHDDHCALTIDHSNQNQQAWPQCRGLRYNAKFQVIPIRDFRFIVLTYPQTNPHHDKAIAMYAPPAVIGRRRVGPMYPWLCTLEMRISAAVLRCVADIYSNELNYSCNCNWPVTGPNGRNL